MSVLSPLSKVLVLGAVMGVAVAQGAAVSLDNLVTDSPFVLKQEENTAPAPAENATLEFRGYQQTPDGLLFGLYDRTKNQGAWVKQGDPHADYKVSSYDAGSEQVTVEYQGQRLSLSLASAKIGAAAPSPLPVVNNGARPASPGQPAAAARGGTDQQRLESVAAEVRRRRALRQAAASQAAPATAAPAQTSGQQQ